jgi:hypothetical protein
MVGNDNHDDYEHRTEPAAWERQPAESEPAFQAFRTYLEMADERSVRAVAQRLHKSSTMVGRWSKRWKWVARIRKYSDNLAKKADQKAERHAQERVTEIMASHEVLGLTSLLARTSFDDILDDKGHFDLAKARRTSAIFAIKKLTFCRYGRIKSIELRDKVSSLEIMGKYRAVDGGMGRPAREVSEGARRPETVTAGALQSGRSCGRARRRNNRRKRTDALKN